MLSRRSRFEFACRVGAFAILGWLLGASAFPSSARGVDTATDESLESKLPAWTRAPSTIALHASLSAAPAPWVVDWLAALAHSGHSVTWSGTPPAVALNAEPLVDPDGGVRVNVAAPARSMVAIRDDAGSIDSVRVVRDGASVVTPMVIGHITAAVGTQTLRVDVPDTTPLRAIVVAGEAGWEGKFIASALEERGWPVIARFSVAPNVDVSQSTALTLDTSRVAAVVLIDTTTQSFTPALERFVKSGGGLVLAGTAAASSKLASLTAGTIAQRARPAREPTDTIGLGSTGFYPVSARRDAVVLDRRPLGVSMAARRVGAGRVVQVGFDDSWRWRMAGAPGSERAHREWWSRVVGSVAYVPATSAEMSNLESAPLARLIARVGPARTIAGIRGGAFAIDPRVLLTLMMILLLCEWTSRRLRGMR